MKAFSAAIVRYRILVLVLALALSGAAAWQLQSFSIESDIISYLPETDPDVVHFKDVGKTFGGTDLVMVGLEVDDVFTTEALTIIRDLTERYRTLDGVRDVVSLTNILDFQKRDDGAVDVVKLVDKDKIPTAPAELERLKAYTLGKDLYNGAVVSADGKVALIACRIQDDAAKDEVSRQIMEAAEERVGSAGKLYFAGLPATIVAANDIIVADMSNLILFVALVIVAVLFGMFGSIRGVVLPLGAVALSTLWTAGLMLLMERPVTMITAIMPVVLLATGSAYGIHMVSAYNEEAGNGVGAQTTVRRSLAAVGLAIILTGVTTFVGFATLGTSTLSIISDFGIFTAVGVVLALISAVVIIPAVLSYLPVRAGRRVAHGSSPSRVMVPFLGLVARMVARRGGLIVVAAVVLTAAAAVAIPSMRTDVNMLSYFPEDSHPRRSEELLIARFGGSTPLFVDVHGELKAPGLLKAARRIAQRLEVLPHVGTAQSIADLLIELNDVMNGRRRIPDTPEQVGNLWFLLEGQEVVSQLVDKHERRGLIQAKIDQLDTEVIGDVAEAVDTILAAGRWDLRPVRFDTLPPAAQARALKFRAEWISEGITLAVHKHTGSSLGDAPRASITKVIEDDLAVGDDRPPSPSLKQMIAPAVLGYARSKGADMDFTAEAATRLADAVAATLDQRVPSRKDLRRALESALGGTEAEADEEDIDYTLKSLSALVDVAVRAERAEVTWARILPLIPNAPADSRVAAALAADAIGELWEASAPVFYLPADTPAQASTFEHAGLHLILRNLNTALVSNQLQGMGLALLLVLLLMILQFRSLVGGLMAMVPITLTVVMAFGVMAYSGLPLDNATAMIASVTIGIGIDYSIHFLSRLKREYAASRDTREAVRATLQTTGRAILTNALAVGLGFLVLQFSGLLPLRAFGVLTALNMIICAAGALTVLPAILLLIGPRFLRRGLEPVVTSGGQQQPN